MNLPKRHTQGAFKNLTTRDPVFFSSFRGVVLALHAYEPLYKEVTHSAKVQVSDVLRGGGGGGGGGCTDSQNPPSPDCFPRAWRRSWAL